MTPPGILFPSHFFLNFFFYLHFDLFFWFIDFFFNLVLI
jgi:hypothetical protein